MKTNTVINNADVISSTILMQTGKLEQNELSDTIKRQIKQAFILIEKHGKLSPNGEYFVKSLKKSFARHKSLSERQQKALFEIRNNLI